MSEEHHGSKNVVSISKSMLWMMVSGILGLLLVVSVFTQGFGIVAGKSAVPSGYAPLPSPSRPRRPTPTSGNRS